MSKLGTVYKIEYKDEGILYIGSTLEKFNTRVRLHKKNYKRYIEGKTRASLSIYHYFDEFGIDNFKFEKIKEYNCCDKKHLFAYEQLYINKTDCVNILNPFRINKLTHKKYRNEHKEERKNNFKNWNEKNREKNREIIKCECGSYYTTRNKSSHFKTKLHQDFLTKGIIKPVRKTVSIDCECGGCYTKNDKGKHFKTKKHQNFINNKSQI